MAITASHGLAVVDSEVKGGKLSVDGGLNTVVSVVAIMAVAVLVKLGVIVVLGAT